MALKSCPKCGNQISDKASVCPKCGADLKTDNSTVQNSTSHSLPELEIHPSNPSNKKKWWWLAAVLIVLIGTGVFVGLYQHNQYLKEQEELARREQLRRDSIAAVEAELARLEQLRQDSIRLAQEELANRLVIGTFCKYDSNESVMATLSSNKISSNLENLGFTLINTNQTRTEVCGDGSAIEIAKIYQRDKYGYDITVRVKSIEGWVSPAVEILFPNSELKNEFLKTAVKNKYKKSSSDFYQGPNLDCYWYGTDIYIKGNNVNITPRFEC